MRVTSARNERIQATRRLARDAAERRAEGLCLVEGVRVAREYLRAGGPVRWALVSPRLDDLDGAGELRRELALSLDDPERDILETPDEVLASAVDTRSPQGIALVVPAPRHEGLPEADDRPVVVAWELQDPGNAGTLVRTAEGAGCAAFVAARAPGGAAADPFSPRALRGAAGSAFRLPVHEWTGAPGALDRALRDAGFTAVACVARDGVPPEEADLRGPRAILVGSEAHGLPEELTRAPALRVTIPLAGAAESLNAGAAAAVIAFEAARQRRSG